MAPRDRERASRDRDKDEDEEPIKARGSSRGRGRDADEGDGVDLDADFIAAGLFGPGPAEIVESVFADYTYGGTMRKPSPVWLITFERDKEKYEQPYSVGSGWRVSADGSRLIPEAGQTGLPDSCNAAKYLVGPLRELGFKGKLGSDPRGLEGLQVVLDRVAQEKREGLDQGGGRDRDRDRGRGRGRDDNRPEDRQRTILTIVEIEGKGKSGKSEKPTSRTRDKAKDDDDDKDEPEREEKPSRGRSGKTDKGRGKAKDEEKDEPEENDAEKLTEDAVEAVIEVLEAEDAAVAIDDLGDLLKTHLKGNDDARAIIKIALEDDFLAEEKGWKLNTRRGTLALDK